MLVSPCSLLFLFLSSSILPFTFLPSSVSNNLFTPAPLSLLSLNTLPRKMSENFQRHLKTLEMRAKQSLQSLLSAPMQRITKLPLLMKEIQKSAPNDHPSHERMESCHRAVEKVSYTIYSCLHRTFYPLGNYRCSSSLCDVSFWSLFCL